MKKALIASLLLVVSIPAAQAQEEDDWFFFGVGIGFLRLDGGGDDAKPVNSSIRGGINLNEYLDIGVEVGNSISEDEIDGFEYEIDTTFIYLKANYVIDEDTKIYALGGASEFELTTTFPQPVQGQSKAKGDDTGFSYGIGVEFRQDKTAAFTIEYINYFNDEIDDTGVDFFVDSLNFGMLWYF